MVVATAHDQVNLPPVFFHVAKLDGRKGHCQQQPDRRATSGTVGHDPDHEGGQNGGSGQVEGRLHSDAGESQQHCSGPDSQVVRLRTGSRIPQATGIGEHGDTGGQDDGEIGQ